MIQTVEAVIDEAGRVHLLESIRPKEARRALVTILEEEPSVKVSEEGEADFWQAASSSSLDEIWDNTEDDIYAELLKA